MSRLVCGLALQVALCAKVVVATMHAQESRTPDVHRVAVVAAHEEVAAVLALDPESLDVELGDGPPLYPRLVRRGRGPVELRSAAVLLIATVVVATTLHRVATSQLLHNPPAPGAALAVRSLVPLVCLKLLLPPQLLLNHLALPQRCACSFYPAMILLPALADPVAPLYPELADFPTVLARVVELPAEAAVRRPPALAGDARPLRGVGEHHVPALGIGALHAAREVVHGLLQLHLAEGLEALAAARPAHLVLGEGVAARGVGAGREGHGPAVSSHAVLAVCVTAAQAEDINSSNFIKADRACRGWPRLIASVCFVKLPASLLAMSLLKQMLQAPALIARDHTLLAHLVCTVQHSRGKFQADPHNLRLLSNLARACGELPCQAPNLLIGHWWVLLGSLGSARRRLREQWGRARSLPVELLFTGGP
mmetsp:Transcript_49484/g.143544  ORF Transcript_49484/g.143544 Transcript_49484/m.143544 type:complete len:424 (-) Transcript_49484:473-1744(-)